MRFFRGWALLLILALGACQQQLYLDPSQRHSSVGKSKAEILAQFGQPDETYVEDGKEYLSYVHHQNIPYGYWNGTYYVTVGHTESYCRVTFLIVAEKVIQDYAVGQSCGER
jgi:hypothetical protein